MSKRITAADRELSANEKRVLTTLIERSETLLENNNPNKDEINELLNELESINDSLITKPFITNKNKVIELLKRKLDEKTKVVVSDPSKTSIFSKSRKGLEDKKKNSESSKKVSAKKATPKKVVKEEKEVEEIGTVIYTVKLEGRIVEAVRNRAHSQRVEMTVIYNEILRNAFSDNELKEGQRGFEISQEVQRKRGVRKMKRKGD